MCHSRQDVAESRKLQTTLKKSPRRPRTIVQRAVEMHLELARHLGYPIAPGQKVLDVGCGIGESVEVLGTLGYDAQGIDVLELWGADYDQYWADSPKPAGEILERLHRIDPDKYRIPFPDAYFDFAFSDQVFEHVFNTMEVMSEINRVLKPGAISVHHFPGPNGILEPHLSVPLTSMCRYRWWLALWAILGLRSSRQEGMSWRLTLETSLKGMTFCNYLRKSELKSAAQRAGVQVRFIEQEELKVRPPGVGSLAKLRDAAPKPFRAFWIACLCVFAQRVMMITGRDAAHDRGPSPGVNPA
jgi:SAM-dependent methyltransferase